MLHVTETAQTYISGFNIKALHFFSTISGLAFEVLGTSKASPDTVLKRNAKSPTFLCEGATREASSRRKDFLLSVPVCDAALTRGEHPQMGSMCTCDHGP